MKIIDISKEVQNNLHMGDVIKNYKVMCELLSQNVCGGSAKKAQIVNWKRFFNFKRCNFYYIITEIYSKPMIDDKDWMFEQAKKNFCIKEENKNSKGVYIIQYNNEIYIGSTAKSFWKRFIEHLRDNSDKFPTKLTKPMIYKGGQFKELWIALDETSEYDIREKEKYYIRLYSQNSKYILLNRKCNSNGGNLDKKYSRVYISDFYIARRLTHKKFHICDIINLQNEITYVFTYTPRLSNYLNDNNIKFLASSK